MLAYFHGSSCTWGYARCCVRSLDIGRWLEVQVIALAQNYRFVLLYFLHGGHS